MDKLREMQIHDLRQACREVRHSLIERQNNGKYPKEWNADIDATVDILGDQIDRLSDMLKSARRAK